MGRQRLTWRQRLRDELRPIAEAEIEKLRHITRRETTNEYNPLDPYTGNDVAAQERALSYTFFAALSATHGHPLCIGAIGIMDYISAWSVDLYTRLSQSLLGQPLLSCVHG